MLRLLSGSLPPDNAVEVAESFDRRDQRPKRA
jgi:hypothetical protein